EPIFNAAMKATANVERKRHGHRQILLKRMNHKTKPVGIPKDSTFDRNALSRCLQRQRGPDQHPCSDAPRAELAK
ncbi:MAG TPA: hypothetical protein VMY41_01730, partial [Thermohalobaculum sp.]|nr:hypothetical protein [Thermohalobaculum sp.]